MKFGRRFHEYVIPEWADDYLDYHFYKTRIIQGLDQGELSALSDGVANVNNFYRSKYNTLQNIVHNFCLTQGVASIKSIDQVEFSQFPLGKVRYLQGQWIQMRQRLQKLLWYGQVHKEVINKLCRGFKGCAEPRLAEVLQTIPSLAIVNQTEGLNLFFHIDKAIAHVEHALSQDSPVETEPSSFRRRYNFKCDFGRSELQHCAYHGLAAVGRQILSNKTKMEASEMVLNTKDIDSQSPLEVSVIRGHCAVTSAFLRFLDFEKGQNLNTELGKLLQLAVRLNFTETAQVLIDHGADVDYVSKYGETTLYIAARSGSMDLVQILLRCPQVPQINTKEFTRHWTPLVVSSFFGHASIVEMLLRHGADQSIRDIFGRSAKEHAAYQGHLHLMKMLANKDDDEYGISTVVEELVNSEQPDKSNQIARRPTQIAESNLMGRLDLINEDAVSKNSSYILVSLGSSNLRKPVVAVDLNPTIFKKTEHVPSEVGYALRLSTRYPTSTTVVLSVPVLGDAIDRPWVFTVQDSNQVKIVFDLVQVDSYEDLTGVVLGRGIASLQNLAEGVTKGRETLIRDYHVSILSGENLEYLGSVTFHAFIVKPYAGRRALSPPQPITSGFWKINGPIQVVGHRGSGANSSAKHNLQIGENTIQSFSTAGSLGASCVEFDVQLTRDFQTAIFHDFLVKETGGDIPLHSLTLEQFMLLGNNQSSRGYPSAMAETRYLEKNHLENGNRSKPRSLSLNNYDESRTDDLVTRIKYTIEGKQDIKGNIRGSSIQEPFTTLEELLTKLPESMAFDLEVKYPMLWEAEDRCIDPIAVETNLFVDIILEKVYALAGKRNITFSSFSPEVCILLAYKQREYPVLFINKAGSQSAGDTRASNMQQAVHFAKSWNLAGIVIFADPIVECPSLIGHAREKGLVCASYGNLNDIPANAKIQAKAGLDAIIVNKVRLIVETLKSPNEDS